MKIFLPSVNGTRYQRAKRRGASALVPFLLLILTGHLSCSVVQDSRILSPEGAVAEVLWTEEETQKPVALRLLGQTEEASTHLVRLNTREEPHIHRHHDLVVFILKGKANVSLGGTAFQVKRGDVMTIPRGTVHWAENLESHAAEAFAVFTPPLGREDTELVDG